MKKSLLLAGLALGAFNIFGSLKYTVKISNDSNSAYKIEVDEHACSNDVKEVGPYDVAYIHTNDCCINKVIITPIAGDYASKESQTIGYTYGCKDIAIRIKNSLSGDNFTTVREEFKGGK